MKRIIAVILCTALLASLCACGIINPAKNGSILSSVSPSANANFTFSDSHSINKLTENNTDFSETQSNPEATHSNETSLIPSTPLPNLSTSTIKPYISTLRPPTSTVKPSVSTSKPSHSTSKISSSIKNLLNSAKLNPQKTNAPALDSLVDKLFAKIHKSNMSTYEKVKACYDYLVNNCRYSSSNVFLDKSVVSDIVYKSDYDYWLVLLSYHILSTNKGVCDNYSAAFAVMCRRIGLDAHIIGGTISKKSGGRTPHAWCYINLKGTPYIFDPQVQSNNKNVPYHYFGKTYSQMGTSYQIKNVTYIADDFANFTCYKKPPFDIKMDLEITGEEIYSEIWEQRGTSANYYVSGQFDPIITDTNGCVYISVTPSGGSGKYKFMVAINTYDSIHNANIVINKIITKKETFKLDCKKYDNDNKPRFCFMLFDNLNPDSYLFLDGIDLKNNFSQDPN